ncbi:MAG: XRE family transcriptional regulator [Bacteroidetes bacterium]|nr:MAG: XRE family transcriptional regulator [Bacteroidota bacterium]
MNTTITFQPPKKVVDSEGNSLLLVRKDEYEELLRKVEKYDYEQDWLLYREGKKDPLSAEPLSVVLKRVKEYRKANVII